MKGTILVIYDKTSVPKAGIQFDKVVPCGNTIGQRCPDKYGFIVPLTDIELSENSDWKELIERTALEVLMKTSTGVILHSDSYKPWEDTNKKTNAIRPRRLVFSTFDDIIDYPLDDDYYPTSPRRLSYLPKEENEKEKFIPLTPIKNDEKNEKRKPFIVFFKNLHLAITSIRLKFLKKYLLSLPQNISTVFIASSKLRKNETKKSDIIKGVISFTPLFKYEKPSSKKYKLVISLNSLFSYSLKIVPPKGGSQLSEWKKNIDEDKRKIIYDRNHRIIQLLTKDFSFKICDEGIPILYEKILSINGIRQILGISYADYCNNNKNEENKPIIIKSSILSNSINLLDKIDEYEKDNIKTLKSTIECSNEFEEALLSENVLESNSIGVKFDDIGSLDNIKETLYELVTLPLVRPELFRRGQLRCPCRGILLFGPPGTGKTMLAKGIASESKANFLNISISDIVSKWYGEAEKYVKAVFTLAKKLTPCVIFVDEVEALLCIYYIILNS